MHHRILLVGTILIFALGAVVLADPPTLSIQQQATLERFQGFPLESAPSSTAAIRLQANSS